jgi:hypothetical protein
MGGKVKKGLQAFRCFCPELGLYEGKTLKKTRPKTPEARPEMVLI